MKNNMLKLVASYIIGTLFGIGLIISGMVNPAKVIGFLDIAGHWDPSLAFVMGGALIVTTIGYAVLKSRAKPFLEDQFYLPTKTKIDTPLLAGSAMFGIGWGMGGFCPGPGITALTLGYWEPIIFVAAMAAGMLLTRLVPENQ